MFPIAEDKFLLDFLGKPLLEHQIEASPRGRSESFRNHWQSGKHRKDKANNEKICRDRSRLCPAKQSR